MKNPTSHFRGITAATILTGFICNPVSALTFVLTDTTPGGMSPAAFAGFQQAANIWSANVTDAITVNLNIRFDGGLPANVLGSAGSSAQGISYDSVRAALVLNSFSADDVAAVASLPLGSSLSFLTNDSVTSAVFTDNNATVNNTILNINTANAKALGLRPANDPAVDASIRFNSTFTWDFDQSDGVDNGSQDFVGVTVHEIGHALGFVSGVDDVDATHGSGPDAPENLDGFRVHSVLDLFRYSSAGQLNYATGGTPYFSIDGGTTNLGGFSTGASNGDGRQASHWKDNLALGIMDPTANNPFSTPPGNENHLSALDLRAFDVIGYELVPEPTSAVLTLLGGCFLLRRRRRA